MRKLKGARQRAIVEAVRLKNKKPRTPLAPCPRCARTVVNIREYRNGSKFYIHRFFLSFAGLQMDGCTVAKNKEIAQC